MTLTCMVVAQVLLQRDYSFLRDINIWNPFVTVGVYSSTFSAAMSNLIGASRILYALARDDLFGKVLSPAKKTSHSGNPWVSVIISWFLVQGAEAQRLVTAELGHKATGRNHLGKPKKLPVKQWFARIL
ncbi:hypothetical protein NQZ68_015784 [Dissostichus eleginoides]|nr:hypothetical protein NQZ68_015784 [Dissostichus eleginoides]